MFNEMFKFFIENELLLANQFGFKPGDSCVNQLVSANFKFRGVFLDISKAFDKVWQDDIIFKLTQNEISGNLLKVLRDFLSERGQRVVPNSQAST